jgi:hypothetical protein
MTDFNKLSYELQEFLMLATDYEMLDWLQPDRPWRSFAHGVVMAKASRKNKMKWVTELEKVTDQWEKDNNIKISHWEFEQFDSRRN